MDITNPTGTTSHRDKMKPRDITNPTGTTSHRDKMKPRDITNPTDKARLPL